MKKLLLSALTVISFNLTAQVGIGTTSPNKSAVLDVTASDKGMLIPRVALTSITDVSTITEGNVVSLMVFNTATISDVTPGFYFWAGSSWKRIQDSKPIKSVSNELIFDGIEDASPANDNFRYVSMEVDDNWKVIRYTKSDVNVEAVATITNNAGQTDQPETLAECTALAFM